MDKNFDYDYMLNTLKAFIEIPSPVGYYNEIHPMKKLVQAVPMFHPV